MPEQPQALGIALQGFHDARSKHPAGYVSAFGGAINNFTSRHGRGGNYFFADAHVGMLGEETDYATFKALSTRSKGEVVQGDR